MGFSDEICQWLGRALPGMSVVNHGYCMVVPCRRPWTAADLPFPLPLRSGSTLFSIAAFNHSG